MNIKIDRDILLTPLSNVSGIVEKKHTLPILSHLLLEGIDGELRFTATDLEMQISLSIKTNLKENFQTTVSARKLFDITRSLPEKSQLDFQVEETKITVKSSKSGHKINRFAANNGRRSPLRICGTARFP